MCFFAITEMSVKIIDSIRDGNVRKKSRREKYFVKVLKSCSEPYLWLKTIVFISKCPVQVFCKNVPLFPQRRGAVWGSFVISGAHWLELGTSFLLSLDSDHLDYKIIIFIIF